MDPAPTLDPNTRAALQKLADVVLPPEVSLFPATWGWAVLVGAAAVALVLVAVRLRRGRASDRYRREALAELDAIEASIENEATRWDAILSIPQLLKRVALAAWPRSDVASLSGEPWRCFLQVQNGAEPLPSEFAAIVYGMEYRGERAIGSIDETEALVVADAARAWIARHHGPA